MAEQMSTPDRGWIDLDVAMAMLGTGRQHTYRLAREEGWRRKPATRPRQWALVDVHRTWKALNTETKDPTDD